MFSKDESLAYTESKHIYSHVGMLEEVNRATSRTISPAVEKHKALQDQTVRDGRGEVKLDQHKPELGHYSGAGAKDGVTAWRQRTHKHGSRLVHYHKDEWVGDFFPSPTTLSATSTF